MTLYEEIYKNFQDKSKFYRFEGYNSSVNYSFTNDEYLINDMRYLYFSSTIKHHNYFVSKKLKQIISKEILHHIGYKQLNKVTLLNPEVYNIILANLDKLSTADIISIEYNVLPIINSIVANNSIRTKDKDSFDRRIERVDAAICGGGYGFSDEYLKLFDLLTFFYSYQKITPENIARYLYNYRRRIIENNSKIISTEFLTDESKRIIKINPTLFKDFTKYELMDALEKIIEAKKYFPESIFSQNPSQQVKSIIQDYNMKRERVLKLADTIYKRNIEEN